MKVCYAEQMRNIDRIAAEKFGIPSVVLMENAAAACVEKISRFDSFVIVCGKGNNGGDGLAVARRLINMHKRVEIYLACGNEYSGDALINYNILMNMGIEFCDISDFEAFSADLRDAECTVDALLGTGMSGSVRAPLDKVIRMINEFSGYVLSVDVPSGINSDTGEIGGCCVNADETVTFAAYKTGLLLYPAADFTGKITVADISIPQKAFEFEKTEIDTLTDEYIKNIMPKRKNNSQKGDYGKVLVIGGSVGMAGAVCLACEAAFKVGAGMVTACVPCEINDVVQSRCTVAMTIPVDFERDGDIIIDRLSGFDAILFGNGMGREDFVADLLERVLSEAEVPVIIDADGLFALAKNPYMAEKCKSEIVITPHSMEMARLLGCTVGDVEKNRFSVSKNFVLSHRLTLVLKGNHSIITAPDGHQSVNLTGNNGMATAGSGDVLAGMTAGFAARGTGGKKSAELAVYLHGKAGDRAAHTNTRDSMTAVDILDAIHHILPVEN